MLRKLLLSTAVACVALAASAIDVPLTDGTQNLSEGEVKIARSKLTALPAGTVLTIDYTLNEGVDDAWFRMSTSWGHQALPDFTPVDDNGYMHVSASGHYNYTLSQEILSDLDNSDFHGWDGDVTISGAGMTVTKVYVTLSDRESLISEPINLDDTDWKGVTFPKSVITSANPDWPIVMTYTLNEGASDAYFRWATSYGNTQLPGFEGTATDSEGKSIIPVSANGSYVYKITEAAISDLDNSDIHGWDNEIHIIGSGITVTKLELVRSTEISTVITPAVSDTENISVRYFTMQGVEVTNPGKGIYIRVEGNKATKIYKQ